MNICKRRWENEGWIQIQLLLKLNFQIPSNYLPIIYIQIQLLLKLNATFIRAVAPGTAIQIQLLLKLNIATNAPTPTTKLFKYNSC